MNESEIKQYIEQEVERRVQNRLDFLYNVKYRFDLPVEISKSLNVGTSPVSIGASYVKLTDLPTSATGLDTGQLYNDTGTIKIVT